MPDTPATTPLTAQLNAIVDHIRHQRWQQAKDELQPLKQQLPAHPHILHLWGLICQGQGDLRGASEALSQAVAKEPHESSFHLALGVLLKQKRVLFPAKERLQESLRLDPNSANAHFHLGDLLMDEGAVELAITHLQQAVRLQPDFFAAWMNLGLCQKSRTELPQARASFLTALRLQPDNATVHINLAMTHLMMGNYAQGWQEYEWRLQLGDSCLHTPPPKIPRWQGESLHNKNILIIAEQGYGDILQFIRLAPALSDAGAKLYMTAPTPLLTLLQQAPGVTHVQNHGHFTTPLDYYIPLLSLPALLGITLTNIPFQTGYLTPPPVTTTDWSDITTNAGHKKIGLVWEGKPLHQNDPLRKRSCTLAELAPLAEVANIEFFSLQIGPPNQQAKQPPAKMQLQSLETQLTDFGATAQAMAHLDLIITIDTATAHLAGALGKPVWTLLPMAPDWRWGSRGPTTPWYATMRLFRQTSPDCWREPILQMQSALETLP